MVANSMLWECLQEMSAPDAARRLLGCELVRTVEGISISVRVVETEAYDQTDLASHSYRGMTERTKVMFGSAGHLYVYFTYGMHFCCNIVIGNAGHGAAVLIRAVEPISGLDTAELYAYRAAKSDTDLTNGPAKLCQALSINKTLNGHDLKRTPLQLIEKQALPDDAIWQTTRVGIRQAVDTPWRFYIRDNPFVSKK